jgi:calcineurin-like phosphoesterase family protein
MAEVFVLSDLHLGHKNILTFKHGGHPLRPFATLEEMHDTILGNWRKTVAPADKIYVLGDVCFGLKNMELFADLPGKKRLVMGNHDLFDYGVYAKYFQKIMGVRQLNGVWLTHVPMHLDCVNQERVKCNIHGHLHANKIDHPKYFNACCEHLDYTPKHIDEIIKEVNDRLLRTEAPA